MFFYIIATYFISHRDVGTGAMGTRAPKFWKVPFFRYGLCTSWLFYRISFIEWKNAIAVLSLGKRLTCASGVYLRSIEWIFYILNLILAKPNVVPSSPTSLNCCSIKAFITFFWNSGCTYLVKTNTACFSTWLPFSAVTRAYFEDVHSYTVFVFWPTNTL